MPVFKKLAFHKLFDVVLLKSLRRCYSFIFMSSFLLIDRHCCLSDRFQKKWRGGVTPHTPARTPLILGIIESKLDSSITNAEVNINGYSIIGNDRNRNGGGVACYIRNDLSLVPKIVFQIH